MVVPSIVNVYSLSNDLGKPVPAITTGVPPSGVPEVGVNDDITKFTLVPVTLASILTKPI